MATPKKANKAPVKKAEPAKAPVKAAKPVASKVAEKAAKPVAAKAPAKAVAKAPAAPVKAAPVKAAVSAPAKAAVAAPAKVESKPVKAAPVKAESKPAKGAKAEKTIHVYSPASGVVAVAGEFNNWDPAKGVMKRESDGNWVLKVKLAPGQYQFKLVFDESSWESAPGYPLAEGEHGNSLLIVE